MWGFKFGEGWIRYLFAIGLPIIFAIIWGVFAVPNDPSRSGNAPIVTPGIIRLILELAMFGFAIWALLDLGHNRAGIIMGIVTALHYMVSYDRVSWLINQ